VLLWAVGALPRSSTVLLAALVVLFLGPTQLVVSLLSGRERFKQLALWQVGTGLVNPAATVLVLLAGGGVLAVLAVDVLATALGLAVLLRVARPVRWRLRGSPPAGFWRYSWAYAGLIVLGIVVFQRSEIVILERLRDTSDVALYGIAFGLAQIVARLTGPALGVLTPAFARMHGESAAGDATGVQASVNLALLLGTGLSAVGAAVATPTVTLLYGDRYADAGPATAVLLASSWVVLLNGVLTAVAQARAQMRVLLAVNGVAAVFNVVAGIVLIASSGVMGAAVANAAAQAAVTLGVAVWARRALPEVRYGHLGRVLLPALLAYAVGRAAAPLPDAVAVVVGGVVGAVAFLLAARLTGALDAETLALTRRVLRARRR
jgi:O-antigen/teichoic acid export membrane protein